VSERRRRLIIPSSRLCVISSVVWLLQRAQPEHEVVALDRSHLHPNRCCCRVARSGNSASRKLSRSTFRMKTNTRTARLSSLPALSCRAHRTRERRMDEKSTWLRHSSARADAALRLAAADATTATRQPPRFHCSGAHEALPPRWQGECVIRPRVPHCCVLPVACCLTWGASAVCCCAALCRLAGRVPRRVWRNAPQAPSHMQTLS